VERGLEDRDVGRKGGGEAGEGVEFGGEALLGRGQGGTLGLQVGERGGVLHDGAVEVLSQGGGQGREEGVLFGVAGDRGGGEVGGGDWEGDIEGGVEKVGRGFGFGFVLLGRGEVWLLCWLWLLLLRVVLLAWRIWRDLLSSMWRILAWLGISIWAEALLLLYRLVVATVALHSWWRRV
jgi:hypothetical protein